jgi:hypothetical protein
LGGSHGIHYDGTISSLALDGKKLRCFQQKLLLFFCLFSFLKYRKVFERRSEKKRDSATHLVR